MMFAEKLKQLGRKFDQEEYEAARRAEIAKRGMDRLKVAIEEEYSLFRDECLKAVQRGEWRCTMQIERDRYGGPKRVNELLLDETLSYAGKWSCIDLCSIMQDHFTEEEVSVVQIGIEERLRSDGFVGTMIAAVEDSECGGGDWRYHINVSAVWWGLI